MSRTWPVLISLQYLAGENGKTLFPNVPNATTAPVVGKSQEASGDPVPVPFAGHCPDM